MDGENKGKPLSKWDDLGGVNTPIFGSTPTWILKCMAFLKGFPAFHLDSTIRIFFVDFGSGILSGSNSSHLKLGLNAPKGNEKVFQASSFRGEVMLVSGRVNAELLYMRGLSVQCFLPWPPSCNWQYSERFLVSVFFGIKGTVSCKTGVWCH